MKRKRTASEKINISFEKLFLMAIIEIVFALIYLLLSRITSAGLVTDIAIVLATINVLAGGVTLVVAGWLGILTEIKTFGHKLNK